jgi:hypothetical protein
MAKPKQERLGEPHSQQARQKIVSQIKDSQALSIVNERIGRSDTVRGAGVRSFDALRTIADAGVHQKFDARRCGLTIQAG